MTRTSSDQRRPSPVSAGSGADRASGRIGRTRVLRWRGRRVEPVGYLFVLPLLVPFLLFTVVPILFGIVIAFSEWSVVRAPEFVGLDNFGAVLRDQLAIRAFQNTLVYAIVIVPSVTVLGLAFALFVDRRLIGHTIAQAAFFSPYVVSATVIGIVWVWILDTQHGIINQYIGVEIPWLSSTSLSLFGVSIASIWWDVGLAFVLFLAALQDIDPRLGEAASVDGASRLQAVRHITVPLLRPTISLVVTLQAITTLRIFSQVHLMTDGRPAGSSMSVMNYIIDFGIGRFQFGFASAMALLLFAVIAAVTLIGRLIVRERSA